MFETAINSTLIINKLFGNTEDEGVWCLFW